MERIRNLRGLVFTICILSLAVAGCQLFINTFRGGIELSSYPHDAHLDADIECLDCHGEENKDGLPSFPTKEECAECHDEEGDEALLSKFFEGETAGWVHAGRQGNEIVFDHALHSQGDGESCVRCHDDVSTSSSIWSFMKAGMDDCEACHEEEGRSREECSVCHREIRKENRPATHGGAWEFQHGERSREGGIRTADRCGLCHTEAGCDECHLNNPPRSHNHYWKGRGHGLMAGIYRDRCDTCHGRDTCDRCHSTTQPRSHIGNYGSPGNRHCVSCHLPLSGLDHCNICHLGTVSHDAAPGLPINLAHQLASDPECRNCHFPLPHPDNGQSCRLCHF